MTNINPDRQGRVRKTLAYFSVTACFTGVVLLSLCTEMICRYLILGNSTGASQWFFYTAQVHGFGYMASLIATVNLGIKACREPAKWIITTFDGVIPFLSFFVEKKHHEGVEIAFQLK